MGRTRQYSSSFVVSVLQAAGAKCWYMPVSGDDRADIVVINTINELLTA